MIHKPEIGLTGCETPVSIFIGQFNNLIIYVLLFGMLTGQGIHVATMYTPGLSDVLQMEPVRFQQWGVLLVIALALIVVDESRKLLKRH